jgi:hypothetical protein
LLFLHTDNDRLATETCDGVRVSYGFRRDFCLSCPNSVVDAILLRGRVPRRLVPVVHKGLVDALAGLEASATCRSDVDAMSSCSGPIHRHDVVD